MRARGGAGRMNLGRVDLGRVTRCAQHVACHQRVIAHRAEFEGRQELMDDHWALPTTGTIASSSFWRERATSNSGKRAFPAATSCARSVESEDTRATASATVYGSFCCKSNPASPTVPGIAVDAYATMG